jgi:hypothetical protein
MVDSVTPVQTRSCASVISLSCPISSSARRASYSRRKNDVSFPRPLRSSLSALCLSAKDVKLLSDEYVVEPNARLLISLDVPQLKFNAEPPGESPGPRQLPSVAANIHLAVAFYPKRHPSHPTHSICVQYIRLRSNPARHIRLARQFVSLSKSAAAFARIFRFSQPALSLLRRYHWTRIHKIGSF